MMELKWDLGWSKIVVGGGLTMEERVEVMTNEQWDGMIKMVMKIVGNNRTTDDALDDLRDLLRDKKDADAIIEKIKAKKAESK